MQRNQTIYILQQMYDTSSYYFQYLDTAYHTHTFSSNHSLLPKTSLMATAGGEFTLKPLSALLANNCCCFTNFLAFIKTSLCCFLLNCIVDKREINKSSTEGIYLHIRFIKPARYQHILKNKIIDKRRNYRRNTRVERKYNADTRTDRHSNNLSRFFCLLSAPSRVNLTLAIQSNFGICMDTGNPSYSSNSC